MGSKHRQLLMMCAATMLIAAGCIANDNRAPVEPQRGAAHDLLGALNFGTDTVVTVFTLDPSVTSAYPIAGVHRLWVQAGGVCALTAPYGVQFWNTTCALLTSPIVVTAKTWTDSSGHPRIDFWPALRFAPLDGKHSAAELYIKDMTASADSTAVILYCNEAGCVNEALTDSTLVTLHDKQQGFVYRRIKHFSGYEVSTGRSDSTADSTVQQ